MLERQAGGPHARDEKCNSETRQSGRAKVSCKDVLGMKGDIKDCILTLFELCSLELSLICGAKATPGTQKRHLWGERDTCGAKAQFHGQTRGAGRSRWYLS